MMKQFEVELDCGCCSDILNFESKEAIAEAFNLVGLTSSAIITDQTGKTVEGVDTFYGFREVGSKEKKGKLEILFERAFGGEENES